MTRLLCFLGLHHWNYFGHTYGPWAACDRCGTVR